jgi:hypothetical protein
MILTGDPVGAAAVPPLVLAADAEESLLDELLLADDPWLPLLEHAASAITAIAVAPAAPPLRSVRRDLIGLLFSTN